MKILPSLRNMIAQEVARHLPGYSLAPYDPGGGDSNDSPFNQSCRLTRTETFTEGPVIQLRLINFTHIQIDGHWPRSKLDTNKMYPDEERRTKAITVVFDTPEQIAPEQIANEIQRRFLRSYEMYFMKGIEDRDRYDTEEQAALAFAAELAKLGKGSPVACSPSNLIGNHGAGSFRGQVRHGNTVVLKFSGLLPIIEDKIIQIVGRDALERQEQGDLKTNELPVEMARRIMALFA